MDSGMIDISGNGGGSEEIKILKLGWVVGSFVTCSKKPSNPPNP